MEIKTCPECSNSSVLFITLCDSNTFFEIGQSVQSINLNFYKEWSKNYLCDYWEGYFCFSCGLSEIKPVVWEK